MVFNMKGKVGDWVGGMFVGSRPDPLDYTFNIYLMQEVYLLAMSINPMKE